MKSLFRTQAVILIIFLVSISLRLTFALFNREANDNHMCVARAIMLTNKFPKREACEESFQPKLYHYVVAKMAKEVGYSHIQVNKEYAKISKMV